MTSSRHSVEFYGGVLDSMDNRQGLSERGSRTNSMVGQLTKMMTDQQEAFNNFLKETAKTEKAIQDQVTKIQEEVTSLRQDVSSMKEAQISGRRSTNLKKKLDTKLTGDVKRLHGESENQLDGSKLYADSHNQVVAGFLISQLQDKYEEQESDIKRAVHRYYESRRRLYVDAQLERLHVKEENIRKTKLRGRQRQLYDRRLKHCKTNKEMKYWKQLDERYMTEESDDDEGAFRTHKPIWRSQKLSKLIQMLDKREIRKNIFKKSRKESYMSNSSVPANAPSWAVASYSQDEATSLSQSHSSTPSDIDITPPSRRSPVSTESDDAVTPPVSSGTRQAMSTDVEITPTRATKQTVFTDVEITPPTRTRTTKQTVSTDVEITPPTRTRTTKQTMSTDVELTPPTRNRTTKETVPTDVSAASRASAKPKGKAPVRRLEVFDFDDWDSDSDMDLSDSN